MSAPLRRDRDAETLWLESVRERSGVLGADGAALMAQVLERLDAGGPTIDVRPVDELLHEIAEELADVLGWSLVALQAHRSMTTEDRAALRAIGALAFASYTVLADLAERSGR